MERKEHLEWAKQRALEYLTRRDFDNAVASFLSDLNKHDELRNHPGIALGFLHILHPTESGLRKWIEGFN